MFTDGLVEARAANALLGRDRLAEMFAKLGPRPSALALLDRVQGYASELRDDMAACILEAAEPSCGVINEMWLEEIELNQDQLDLGQSERFLTACGLSEEDMAHALVRIRALVDDYGTGVLTVTLPGHVWAVRTPLGPTFASPAAPPLSRVPIPGA